MSYRPEGYDEIKKKLVQDFFDSQPQITLPELVDKTWDAMLEALKAKGNLIDKTSDNYFENMVKFQPDRKGYLVFIPDD